MNHKGNILMDNVSPDVRKRTMQAVKSNNTKLETKVMQALWRKNIRFKKHVKDLPGIPDICIKSKKIVIFIDSCFWHGCPEHCRMPHSNEAYWEKKINNNKLRDEKNNDYYATNGWTCIRIWEHELKEDFELAIIRIETSVKSATLSKKEG